MTNIVFPGLPEYIGPTSGLFGLVHDDRLAEVSMNIMARVDYIRAYKPAAELAIRLRCLVYLDTLGQPWEKAYWEQATAYQHWEKAYWERATAAQKLAKAWERAYQEWKKAYQHWEPEIEAQIRALVPDLPWNGTQLVYS